MIIESLANMEAFDALRPWHLGIGRVAKVVWEQWRLHLAAQQQEGLCLYQVLNQNKMQWGVLPDFEFVAQHQKPPGYAYETFIHETHCIPTRDNAHDFFNAMMWLMAPQTKRMLNHWQAQEIAKDGIQAKRGELRDALTLFDENVLMLRCTDGQWDALCEHRWSDLFVRDRAQWSSVQWWAFGHALLEKLTLPFKGITAHVVRVPLDQGLQCPGSDEHDSVQVLQPHAWDAWGAQWVQGWAERACLKARPFQVLPVMGIPDWSSEQNSPGFYEDKRVFRPKN